MPFYEYECSKCRYYVEVLQKISDPPLKKCPSCGKSALRKLVSAPVFRLKGSGWYETDFKSDQEGRRNLAGADKDAPAAPADTKAADTKVADKSGGAEDTKSPAATGAGESAKTPASDTAAAPARAGGRKSTPAAAPRKSASSARASPKAPTGKSAPKRAAARPQQRKAKRRGGR